MADRAIAIIGAALDLGAGRRGVDMGPSAIRYAGLEERLTSLGLRLRGLGQRRRRPWPRRPRVGDPRARFLPEIRGTCERVARRVGDGGGGGPRADRARRRPLDRARHARRARGRRGRAGRGAVDRRPRRPQHAARRRRAATSTACRWPPRSAAAGAASRATRGRCLRSSPARTTLIGVRSLDDGERALFGELELARAHDERGRPARHRAARRATRCERAAGAAFVHVSLDMDALDPEVAPGVGTRGARRPDLPRGAPGHGAGRRVRPAGLASRSSRSTRSSTARTRPRRWRSSSPRAPSARGSCSCRRPRRARVAMPLGGERRILPAWRALLVVRLPKPDWQYCTNPVDI